MTMTDRELLEQVVVKVNGIDAKVESLNTKVENLEREVKDIQLTLENETNKNIRLIAEGHFSLNRKLDESLKVNHEKEMLLIRVNKLENEVRRLKERLEANLG